MVEIDLDALTARAAKVLQLLAPSGADPNEFFDVARLSDAMETAYLNADSETNPRSSSAYRLGAHAAYMLVLHRDEILLDSSVELTAEPLASWEFAYIEGCALMLACSIVEQLTPKASLDMSSHPRAAEEFRAKLRAAQKQSYRANPVATELAIVLEKFTGPEEQGASPLVDELDTGVRGRINRMGLTIRLGFTGTLALAFGGLGYLAGYSNTATTTVASELPPPPISVFPVVAPVTPNVTARIFVYDTGAKPVEATQSVTGTPALALFATEVGGRVEVRIHLGRRDTGQSVDRDVQVSLGTDDGVEVTPASTTIVNREHPEPGVGAQELTSRFTPVKMDNDREVIYQFQLAVDADPNRFFCGYNLRPISAFVRAGNNPAVVTAFPLYVVKTCP
ncbi:hypothetical protein [Nocardia aurea]|uniref:Uncharacterized protein n=1 Tax=Nocardia aurea TaxID=2144174 RepID=A0ABV3G1N5_9NOCA